MIIARALTGLFLEKAWYRTAVEAVRKLLTTSQVVSFSPSFNWVNYAVFNGLLSGQKETVETVVLQKQWPRFTQLKLGENERRNILESKSLQYLGDDELEVFTHPLTRVVLTSPPTLSQQNRSLIRKLKASASFA